MSSNDYWRKVKPIGSVPATGKRYSMKLSAIARASVPAESAVKALARIQADPSYNSILHTTCVATMLDGGHAPNGLPQRAGANLNCRIFPGVTQDEVRLTLERVVDDQGIKVTFVNPPEKVSPPPPLTKAVLGPIEMEFSAFAVDGRPDLGMVVYNPTTRADADRIRALVASARTGE